MATKTQAWNSNGNEYDITAKLNSNLATTTSQYKVVCLGFTDGSNFTVHGDNASTSAIESGHCGFGVLQDQVVSGTSVGTVRLMGLTKVYADGAIAVGDPVVMLNVSIGATSGGFVTKYAIGATLTSGGELSWVLGRALQAATLTGQAITIFLNPQLLFA